MSKRSAGCIAHIAAWPSPGSLITRSVSQCSWVGLGAGLGLALGLGLGLGSGSGVGLGPRLGVGVGETDLDGDLRGDDAALLTILGRIAHLVRVRARVGVRARSRARVRVRVRVSSPTCQRFLRRVCRRKLWRRARGSARSVGIETK